MKRWSEGCFAEKTHLYYAEDNIHYLATERLQSDICRVHAIHRKAHIECLFLNPNLRRLPQAYCAVMFKEALMWGLGNATILRELECYDEVKTSRGRVPKMSEQSGTPAGDPFGGRHPTGHERMTGLPWDASYCREEPAPWDIGQPQPAVVRLASEGGFAGAVLDAGCGTGENALHIASLGLSVLGVDVAETALGIARQKAADRRIKAEFAAVDALQLERLGRKFRTVLDCGLFHTFDDLDERTRYVASLASVTEHGGTLYLLCFSDKGFNLGPHPVSQEELRAAFNPSGWDVAAIESDRIQARIHHGGVPAWFATIKRVWASGLVRCL